MNPELQRLLFGPGEMRERIRAHDWSSTALGPPARWPQSLRTALGICLASRFPMLLWWGPEMLIFYNDAYIPIFGGKHPRALGSPGLSKLAWGEAAVREVIEPMLRGVLARGDATWSADQLLVLERHGFREETYFTWSYSPIPDESGRVGGVFSAVTETTARVLLERRLDVLRELLARSAEARAPAGACRAAAQVLRKNPHDLPFALLYLLDDSGSFASLAASVGLSEGHPAAPARVALPGSTWPFAQAQGGVVEAEVAELLHPGERLSVGPWPEPVTKAVVTPLVRTGDGRPYGFLVAGISPRLPLDAAYLSFVQLTASHIAAAVATARAHVEERERLLAEAQIEVRLRDEFLSIAAHELRTPLAALQLQLEGLRRLAARAGEQLAAEPVRERVSRAAHTAQRLGRLVEELLDLSRVTTGRMRLTRERLDLSQVVRDVVERYGETARAVESPLALELEPVEGEWDRSRLEQVVANLLANALKYGPGAPIRIGLERRDGVALLTMRDEGIGIAEADQGRIFERFERAVSETHYGGFGLGLFIVRQILEAMGGRIEVTSAPGEGATFTVWLPCCPGVKPGEALPAPA